jgi:polyhydroxyalkanoate synthase
MKSKPDSAAASVPDLAANAQALGATFNEIWKSMSGLSLPMPAVAELQGAYL